MPKSYAKIFILNLLWFPEMCSEEFYTFTEGDSELPLSLSMVNYREAFCLISDASQEKCKEQDAKGQITRDIFSPSGLERQHFFSD